jgi:hypothetical protein
MAITLAVICNVSLLAAAIRLRIKHKAVFEQYFDGRLFCGSIKQLATMIEIMFKPKKYSLKDPTLTLIGLTFTVSFILFFAYGIVLVAHHKG